MIALATKKLAAHAYNTCSKASAMPWVVLEQRNVCVCYKHTQQHVPYFCGETLPSLYRKTKFVPTRMLHRNKSGTLLSHTASHSTDWLNDCNICVYHASYAFSHSSSAHTALSETII